MALTRIPALAIVCLALAGTAGGAPPRSESKRSTQPNLLLITIDTLRPDHLGCYGYKDIKTPNIDALAATGLRYQNARTVVPTTLPSHSTIMTGTYPMLHGMHDFTGNRLSDQQPTLASILKADGYATGAVIGAAVLDSRFGLNRGFDFYYDEFDFNRFSEANLDAMERPGNVVVDQALRWLEAQKPAQPFFLWVHIYDPHHPYHPPEPYATEYARRPYDGEIAFADAQVGRLLAYLKAQGRDGNTLIALMGDHGESLGEHGELTHGFFIYDATVRVPLLFRPPPTLKRKPKVVTTAVSLVDVLPTVLDYLNINPPAGIQGHSLRDGPQGGPDTVSPVYAETFLPRLHFNWSELRGLQRGDYHFIESPKPELYNVSDDPHELNNLFTAKPAVAQELRGQLASVIRELTPGTELAQKTSLDPAMAERLKALGYAAVSAGATATLSDKDLPDPKDRIALFEKISSAIDDSQHGRYPESIRKLDEALAVEPDSIPVHYLQGLNRYRSRDFAGAVQDFEHVLRLSPDYALAAYYLGLAQVGAQRWDDALASLNRALALDGTNFSAAYNLGAVYTQKRMYQEAFASFRHAVDINPNYAQAHRAMGELHMFAHDLTRAEGALKRAVELAPGDPRTHFALAQLYHAKGQEEDAQRELALAEKLRAEQPNP